jgi:hypothetical protein
MHWGELRSVVKLWIYTPRVNPCKTTFVDDLAVMQNTGRGDGAAHPREEGRIHRLLQALQEAEQLRGWLAGTGMPHPFCLARRALSQNHSLHLRHRICLTVEAIEKAPGKAVNHQAQIFNGRCALPLHKWLMRGGAVVPAQGLEML